MMPMTTSSSTSVKARERRTGAGLGVNFFSDAPFVK